MSQIIAARIARDSKDGYLYVLDTSGRVWIGYFSDREETRQWFWERVELPEEPQ